MDRESLMREIQEITFYLVDLNLFLDTHPQDRMALAEYNAYAEQLAALRRTFNEKFGPMLNFGNQPSSQDNFNWINSPWPWERQ